MSPSARHGLLLAALVACTKVAPAGTPDAEVEASVMDATAPDAILDAPTPLAERVDPYGISQSLDRVYCAGIAGRHIAEKDLRTSFVDGNDLLAIVNRSPTGQLAPDFAPKDLVDLRSGTPTADCDKAQCLRKDAQSALTELLAEMRKRGFAGRVESAYRSYSNQCGTFLRWASKGGFCEATEQSALPGHSQHQLGTTVDLFTEAWTADERGVFREGFGCTPGGKFLQEHAWDFGFVMPYPLHPDDRHPNQKCVARWDIPTNINPKTGYRFEHWHVRFIGKDSALRFRAALEKSGLDSPDEITVEQWLRTEKGITGADSELPVCDGCNCGACATLAEPSKNACDKLAGALHLDAHGKPLKSHGTPMIKNVAPGGRAKTWNGAIVEVKLDVPEQLLTQPPIVGLGSAGYAMGVTFEKLAPYPNTKARAFPPLAHAWVVAVEPVPNDTGTPWPWRAAITLPITGQIYDRANVLLPARAGMVTINVPIPAVPKVRIVLLEGGIPKGDEKTLDLH